jgi:serine protease AprX
LLLIALSSFPASIQAAASESFIVQGSSISAVADAVTASGGQITSQLAIINGVAAYLTPAARAQLEDHPAITAITPNANVAASGLTAKKVKFPSADFPEASGADYVWQQGITGSGITIAVVDSGLAAFNPLVKDTANQNRLLGWVDFVQNRNKPIDPNGHGTHITSIMLNSQTGADGSYNGVAPDANLVAVRVLNKNGRGTYEKVIQGIQWVVDHKDEYNIKIMNLSLTGEVLSPYWADPLNQAVMNAWANGITVITCAGNEGPSPVSISVPGNNPYVITVGAFTDAYTPTDWQDDYLASFSGAGPTLDAFVKPDLVAPGAHMVAMMSNASYISKQHEANWFTGTKYYEMAGTSQAAAVVTGVAALMYQQNPNLTPDEMKYRLMITAMPWIEGDVPVEEARAAYSVFQQGAGRINAPDAVFAVEGVQGAANQGLDIWADMNGDAHYQGFAYYDEDDGVYRIDGIDESVNDGYVVWDGGLGLWSGGLGLWSGGLGLWSGGLGLWSGGLGLWSGGLGLWSGGLGLWSGGLGLWSGGFGLWSGGMGLWSGSATDWNELTDNPSAEMPAKDELFSSQSMEFSATQSMEYPDFSDHFNAAETGTGPWVEED